jgi:hypothetical protein
MIHLLPSVARILVPTFFAAIAVGISAPHAIAEAYTDGGGGETFAVGSQPKAGLKPIAPGIYNVRLIDPNHMTTTGGQWSTCQTLLCGMAYADNLDRTGIVMPQNSSGILMEIRPSDVAVYLFDVVATSVQ